MDWDELMYGDFEFHAEPNEYILNNAYLQAWLLVHYLMIGDDSTYNEALRNYLARYASGDDPETAVVEEFGMSADELGRMILRRYNNKVPAFLMEFRPGIQDHDFVRSELDSSSVEHSLDRLREQFRMRMN